MTLEKRPIQQKNKLPTSFLIRLLRIVLEGNLFEFNREIWIQMLGTAMGTKVAPTYANIFMEQLDK